MATTDKDEDLKPVDSEEEVETGKPEDETTDDKTDTGAEDETGADEGDEESEDGDADEESDDDETEDDDKPKFKKRFTQIKGDKPDEYIPNLEEAYRQSTTEGQRLATQNKQLQAEKDAIASLVANNPELAKLISEATGKDSVPITADPALIQARQDMNERMDREFKEFADKHPEIESDPDVQEKVLATLEEFGAAARKSGRVLSMAEGLKKAWAFHGFDNDSKEDVASRAKDTAARGRTGNGSKKTTTTKTALTPEQIAVGKKFGLTEEQLIAANK